MATTVLHKVLPRGLKTFIKETIRREVDTHLATIARDPANGRGTVGPNPTTSPTSARQESGIDLETIRRDVEADLRRQGFVEAFWRHQPNSESFMIPKAPGTEPARCLVHESSPLPLPPKDLWVGYGETPEQFLALGERDIGAMREMIQKTGSTIQAAGRILDFGCATGRMIRWLHGLTDSCEIWGTDICSTWILWCKQYLNPPFHFTTTTTLPHLPFEDRYFGLIYAGSVFTHIDDLADAWFMELRRILRPGGRLYITIHDRATVAAVKEWPAENWLKRYLDSRPEYAEYCRSEFGMFTLGRTPRFTLVFYDADYLSRKLEPFFRTLSVAVGAYGHQTGVLLERL
jgi:SAM-dependent methyltransferase